MQNNIIKEELNDGIGLKESINIFFMIIVYSVGIGGMICVFGNVFERLGVKCLCPCIRILSDLIPYIILSKNMINKYKCKLKFKRSLELKSYFYIVLILIGYVLTYDNTIKLLLTNLIKDGWYIHVGKEITKNPIAGFISIVLISPVFEEIFFRGIILEQLSKRYKIMKAIFISSVLFSLIHFNLIQGINALAFGSILGYVYLKSNSLLPCIFLHFLNNLFHYGIIYYPYIYKIEFNVVKLLLGVIILVLFMNIFKGSKVLIKEI